MTKIILNFLLVLIFKKYKGWKKYESYIVTFYRFVIHARYLYVREFDFMRIYAYKR
jgi:hypothetical protein